MYYLLITLVILIIYLYIYYKPSTIVNYLDNLWSPTEQNTIITNVSISSNNNDDNNVINNDNNVINNDNDISKYLITEIDDEILIPNNTNLIQYHSPSNNLFLNSDEYQITETTKNALIYALDNI